MIYPDLILNLALLIALSIVSGFIEERFPRNTRIGVLMQGALFGLAAAIGMLRPLDLGPGLIFDGRSVMISLCALFYGPAAASTATAMAIACRVWLGGAGTFTGVLTILSSTIIGLLAHFRLKPQAKPPTAQNLYLLGLAVHLAMVAILFTLPANAALTVVKRIGLPVILLYPLATMLAGKILSDRVLTIRYLAHLQEARQNLDITLQSIGDGVISTDTQGRIVLMNPVAEALTGWQQGEALGRPLEDVFRIVNEETRAEVISPVALVLRERAVVGLANHSILIARNGTEHPIADSGAPIRDRGGAVCGVVLVFRDQTEERVAQKTLKESEEAYRALIERLPDIVIRFDRDGRHLFASNNIADVVDFRAEELIGKTHREVGFPEEQCRFWEKAIRKVFDSGEVYETELTFKGRRGPTIFNWRLLPERDAQGVVRSVLSISRDITAHRRIEQDYRMLFSKMLEGFAVHEIICDDGGRPCDYRFLAVNPAFERITGLRAEDVAGRTATEVLPGIDYKWIERYGKVALTGEPVIFDAYAEQLKKHLEVTAFRPAPDRFACIFSDITGRKQVDEERQKLQAQLHQAQKMESVGRLAGGVAHDFNNMLMVILGHLEMALAKVEPAQSLHSDLMEISKAAWRSVDLTRQLLAFARKQTVAPKVLDLNDTVSGTLKMLRRLIGEEIDLVWMPAANLWSVKIDPGQIDQILANLCVNARDAIAGVGKVTIETGNAAFDNTYRAQHADFVPGEYVCLAVSDDGCGMEKEIVEKIFEPFFTTKGVGEGTGLGLAMVYGIVKQNSGFINVYSEPGKGTAIKIYLPRLVGEAVEARAEEVLEPPKSRGETVLLVEDEPTILDIGKRMLEKLGYRVLTAGAPAEALRLAGEHAGRIDLLMTDVVMPQMNGRELANQATAIRPEIKCLFMSGYTANAIAHHGVLDADVEFIQKPFTWNDLAVRVREVLEKEEDRRKKTVDRMKKREDRR